MASAWWPRDGRGPYRRGVALTSVPLGVPYRAISLPIPRIFHYSSLVYIYAILELSTDYCFILTYHSVH